MRPVLQSEICPSIRQVIKRQVTGCSCLESKCGQDQSHWLINGMFVLFSFFFFFSFFLVLFFLLTLFSSFPFLLLLLQQKEVNCRSSSEENHGPHSGPHKTCERINFYNERSFQGRKYAQEPSGQANAGEFQRVKGRIQEDGDLGQIKRWNNMEIKFL